MENEDLSQDARRKHGDTDAAERRQQRRDIDAAREASGTGPPADPGAEPMQAKVSEEEHTSNRKFDRARAKKDTGENVKLANAELGDDL